MLGLISDQLWDNNAIAEGEIVDSGQVSFAERLQKEKGEEKTLPWSSSSYILREQTRIRKGLENPNPDPHVNDMMGFSYEGRAGAPACPSVDTIRGINTSTSGSVYGRETSCSKLEGSGDNFACMMTFAQDATAWAGRCGRGSHLERLSTTKADTMPRH